MFPPRKDPPFDTLILQGITIYLKYRVIADKDCSHYGSQMSRWPPLNTSTSMISSSNELRIMIPIANYTFRGWGDTMLLLLSIAAILDFNEVICFS